MSENFCGRIAFQARADSDPYQLPMTVCGMLWCHQRESNLRLIITNDLLCHLTMAAPVLVPQERLELSRVAPLVPKTSASTNSATRPLVLDVCQGVEL